ncbi:MAG: DUF3558 domain-containing protein [Bellilinea sp.]|nr:DUF3558 domain-containing protein [Bellilinea sp.]
MFKKIQILKVFVILMLGWVVSACAGASSPTDNPASENRPAALAGQPTAVSQPGSSSDQPGPTSPPENTGQMNAERLIPCTQLIPPDELKNLLSVEPERLAENSFAGTTSCEWKYTPADAVQPRLFYLQAGFDDQAVSLWESTRKAELNNEPSDLVVISVDGLGDENYTWKSAITGLWVAYVRVGGQTLIWRFDPADVLFMASESGLMDMSQRIFERMK